MLVTFHTISLIDPKSQLSFKVGLVIVIFPGWGTAVMVKTLLLSS